MYDFKSLIPRTGAKKWQRMFRAVVDLPQDAVPMTIADMEFKTAPEIVSGLQKLLEEPVFGYMAVPDTYKQSVINWLKNRHDATFEMDDIIATAGVVPSIYQMIELFSEPGDGVIMLTPIYFPFFEAIAETDRQLVECPLLVENLHYMIDYAKLEALAADKKNKILLFCSPHNPIGRVWTKEELTHVADIAVRHNLIVINDEIHHDLIMPGQRHYLLHKINEEIAARTITCTAPTKSFSIAALTIAAILITDPELRRRFTAINDQEGTVRPNYLGMKATEIAYNQCEDWLDEVISEIYRNDQTSRAFFAAHFPEVKIAPLEGTYIQWLDMSALEKEQADFFDFLYQKAYFFVLAGHRFGTGGQGFYRLNLALPNAYLKIQLQHLAEAFGRS